MRIKKAMPWLLLLIMAFIVTSYMMSNSKTKSVKTCFEIDAQMEDNSEIQLVVIVMTKPSDLINRKNIRETWSHLNRKNYFNEFTYKVYFVVAYENKENLKKVINEDNAYNDMLILNEIKDNYENLNKKVISALKYINCKHRGSWFVFKTDTDVLINLKLLVSHLVEIKDKPIDYEGYIVKNAPIIKNKKHKHYEPTNVRNGSKTFLPYAVGPGYIIRTSLLPCMINAMRYSLPYKNEDAYVGSLVNFCSGRLYHNNTLFQKKCASGYNSKTFDTDLKYFKKCVFTHGVKTDEYKDKYKKLIKAE